MRGNPKLQLRHGDMETQRNFCPMWSAQALCAVLFSGPFWRPSLCQNRAHDSLLERYFSIISNPTRIFQFLVYLPYQKSNLPKLVKMCQMRLPQGRVLLQSIFEDVCQLQIDLMIAHWKYICV